MNTDAIILITGATSGIGRAAALHLARGGYRVFATGRKRAGLDSLAKEATGTRLQTLVMDVCNEASIAAAKAEVDRATGGYGLDVLVNNAGYGTSGPTELCTDADMRAQYDTNVFGLMAVTRAFVPAMRERRSGRVINLSSLGGRVTLPLMGVYNSTKYALESLTDALRMEMAPFGVYFSLIEPGVIDTGFSDRSMHEAEKYRFAGSPYAGVTDRAEEIRDQADRMAVGPACIVRAIEKAIRARRPRARYIAPFRARVMIGFMRVLPTRWSDAILRRFVGLTPRALGLSSPARPQLERTRRAA